MIGQTRVEKFTSEDRMLRLVILNSPKRRKKHFTKKTEDVGSVPVT